MSTTNPRCEFGCDAQGWLGEDDDGRPIPCPNCKAHLTVCPDCGMRYVRTMGEVRGIDHKCLGRNPNTHALGAHR